MNRHVPQGGARGAVTFYCSILAKQRLGGLSPVITGNKKLCRNNEYDSNAENKLCK